MNKIARNKTKLSQTFDHGGTCNIPVSSPRASLSLSASPRFFIFSSVSVAACFSRSLLKTYNKVVQTNLHSLFAVNRLSAITAEIPSSCVSDNLRSRSDLVPVSGTPCQGTKKDIVQTPQCSRPSVFTNDLGKVLTIEKSATNLELVLQQFVRK